MKPIRYVYSDSNYEFTLEVIIDISIEKSLKKLYKRWGINAELIEADGCTVTHYDNNSKKKDITKYAIIFKFDTLSHNVIAHECQHLAAFILDDRQIDLKGSDETYENMAWLTGHLNQIVYQIIDKEKLTIHKPLISASIKKK